VGPGRSPSNFLQKLKDEKGAERGDQRTLLLESKGVASAKDGRERWGKKRRGQKSVGGGGDLTNQATGARGKKSCAVSLTDERNYGRPKERGRNPFEGGT